MRTFINSKRTRSRRVSKYQSLRKILNPYNPIKIKRVTKGCDNEYQNWVISQMGGIQ